LRVTRFSSRANLNTFELTVILVVGATGYLGGIITRSLLQQSHAVRITLRPNSNHSDLIGLGAKAAHADLKDPDSQPAHAKESMPSLPRQILLAMSAGVFVRCVCGDLISDSLQIGRIVMNQDGPA